MAIPGGGTLLNPLFQIISFGAGTAMGPVLRPTLQDLANEVWTLHPVRPPDVMTLAAGVSQGQVDERVARAWAKQTGYGDPQFDAMVAIADVGPGMAQAFNLWRRREIDRPGFYRALKRLGLEDEWITNLWNVREVRLDPAQIAVMVQRGIIPDPGFLPVGPPTGVGKVRPMPVANIGAIAEAAAAGVDEERMAALTRIVGLPASPDLAARMTYRNIIERVDFDRAIAEGNTRNEWADALFEGFRQILTPNQYTELELRGYITAAQRRALTDRSGMSHADSDRLLQVLGRSITPHQVVTALARGGAYPGNYDNVPQPYKASIQRSNIREEYAEMAYANRYTYPSFFAVRALLQAGVLTPDAGYQLLLEMGWKPSLARTVADFYGADTVAGAGALVKSARTQAVTEIRNAYLIGQADETQARAWLDAIGVLTADQDGIIPIWNVMREVPQRGLTAAQIKKAYSNLSSLWPRSRALDELALLGYTLEDAATLLDE